MRTESGSRWTLRVFPIVMSVSVATHALAEMEKTFGTAGKEERVLKAGVEAELFRYSGKGFLTHMWFGGDFKNYGLTHPCIRGWRAAGIHRHGVDDGTRHRF